MEHAKATGKLAQIITKLGSCFKRGLFVMAAVGLCGVASIALVGLPLRVLAEVMGWSTTWTWDKIVVAAPICMAFLVGSEACSSFLKENATQQ